ncbi:hypothetical protein [Haloactinomyces albus]|uniref:Uncharacterized protein n=1 Tax=Haloactinomyces albus TaxID=1352928 RepID=A0AAE3ZE95_9ACTN|nr:hypothetical protein [Haloactinomyces albus]MDR7303321.1 hypothetical protein [Haloactinomyces albus]
MPSELHTVPPGLDSTDIHDAIAREYPAINDRHYLANGCLCHNYIDRERGEQVRVVHSPTSGIPENTPAVVATNHILRCGTSTDTRYDSQWFVDKD